MEAAQSSARDCAEPQFIRILVPLCDGAEVTEGVWAERIDERTARVANIPISSVLAMDDVVVIKPAARDGTFAVSEVLRRYTTTTFFRYESAAAEPVVKHLESFGGKVEMFTESVGGVAFPTAVREVDIRSIFAALNERGQARIITSNVDEKGN